MNTWQKPIAHCPAVFAVLVALTGVCLGQQDIQSKVDKYVQTELRTQRIPGLSLAVMTNGQIALAKGYGLANVEHNVPVKPGTIFQSGSVGKQFTATAVMIAGRRGQDRSRRQDYKILCGRAGQLDKRHRAAFAHAHGGLH